MTVPPSSPRRTRVDELLLDTLHHAGPVSPSGLFREIERRHPYRAVLRSEAAVRAAMMRLEARGGVVRRPVVYDVERAA